jgi:hypothetical protein
MSMVGGLVAVYGCGYHATALALASQMRMSHAAPGNAKASVFRLAMEDRSFVIPLWAVLAPLPVVAWGFAPSLIRHVRVMPLGSAALHCTYFILMTD